MKVLNEIMRRQGSPALVVGISGPSGSGKTSVVEALANHFSRSRIVSLDGFYRPATDAPDGSWESPSCIDFEALAAEIESAQGMYSLVLVEGFVLLSSGRICTLLDLIVVLECTQAIARTRRLERDAACDNDPANSAEYYDTHVWPAHERYTSTSVRNARVDLTVDAANLSLSAVVHCIKEFISKKMA
jgi:uridine kinase